MHRDTQQVISTITSARPPPVKLDGVALSNLRARKLHSDTDEPTGTLVCQVTRDPTESWQQVTYPQSVPYPRTVEGLGIRNASHHN
jgi:hypothetical protein